MLCEKKKKEEENTQIIFSVIKPVRERFWADSCAPLFLWRAYVSVAQP